MLDKTDAMAKSIYQRTGKKLTCERCFYMDAKCPTAPHICELERALKEDSEEVKKWILENLADKIKLRRIKTEGR